MNLSDVTTIKNIIHQESERVIKTLKDKDKENLESLIEHAYWVFDCRMKDTTYRERFSDRDIFKNALREVFN